MLNSHIHSYKHFKAIGHFTQMMYQNVKTMGCGMVQYEETNDGSEFFSTILTCNYESSQLAHQPVYTQSKIPASGCKTGTHPNYSALCSLDEVYT